MDDGLKDSQPFKGFDFRVDDDRLEGIPFEDPLDCHDPVFRIRFPPDPDLGFPFGEDVGEVGLDDHQDLLFLAPENRGTSIVLEAFLRLVDGVGLFVPPDRGGFLVEVVLFGVVVDGVEQVKIPVLEVFPPFGQGWALIDFLLVRHGALL